MQKKQGSGPRRGWLRWVAGLPVVLGVVYFVLTSGWFVRSVVLPRVGDSLGATLTAESVSLSPWSSLQASGVRLAPKGGEPLMEVGSLLARYSLWSILRGSIVVDEVVLDRPVVTVVARKGGKSNLDALMSSVPKSAPSKSSRPPTLAIRNVSLKGGVVRFDHEDAGGHRFRAAATGLDVALDKLVSNEPTRTKLGAGLEWETSGGVGDGRMAGRVDGDVVTRLNAEMGLEGVVGLLRLDLLEASGGMQRMKGLGATLDVAMGTTTLTNLTLKFAQDGKTMGQLSAKGQLRLSDSEVRLAYDVQRLDARVLGLLGAVAGVDLGDASMTASGRVDWLERGTMLATDGTLNVAALSVGTLRGRTKAVDIGVQHRAVLNQRTRSLLVEQLNLGVRQGGAALISGSLDNGLNISWDKTAPGFREATYTVNVTELNLADWAPLLPLDEVRGGMEGVAKVTFDDAGRSCVLKLDGSGKGLGLAAGGRRYEGLGMKARVVARLRDFEHFNTDAFELELKADGSRLAMITGIADGQVTSGKLGAQVDVEVPLATALKLHPIEAVNLREGSLKAGLMVSARGGLDQADADLSINLTDLSGRIGGLELTRYQALVAATAGRSGTAIAIRKLSVSGQSGVDSGGSIECFGQYDLATENGRLDLKLIGVNQSMLQPFVAPSLAPNRLVSLNLDLDAKASVTKGGKASASGRGSLSKVIVSHPDGRIPEVPFGLALDFDGSTDGTLTELRRANVSLGPTDRATNRIEMTALIDLGTNSPQPSRVTVKSTSLDLTPLYDLLSSATNSVKSTPSTGEPAAVQLPMRQLTATVDIPKLYLHEIDLSNISGKAVVQDNVVSLDDAALRFNGAPVQAKAKVNLGRPGYEYALSFSADRIPIAPVVNSLLPTLRNLAEGTVIASADVRGAGVTGLSLKKSLAGFVDLRATNCEVRIPSEPIQVPALLSRYIPILPETIHPAAILTLIGKTSVLAEPFRVLEARADMGQGVIKVSNARFLSAAMGVQVAGDIRIADDLNQSVLDLPISLAFASGNQLPALRTVGRAAGTLQKPSFKPDVLGLGAVVGSVTLPGIGNVGTKATDALKAAGSNLNQATGGVLNKAASAVEAVANQDPKAPGNPLGGLIKGVLQPGAQPGAKPDTNPPAKPGLLDLLPGGKGKK